MSNQLTLLINCIHTYKPKLGELQEEPFLRSLLDGESLHFIEVTRFCDNVIFQLLTQTHLDLYISHFTFIFCIIFE